ncbi:hypothetical protein [Actinomadura soli]|nr:hypothetical protein [Actinomadura soli]
MAVLTDPGPTPEGPRYRTRHDHVFGDQINAGGYTIDSSAFLPYEDDDA